MNMLSHPFIRVSAYLVLAFYSAVFLAGCPAAVAVGVAAYGKNEEDKLEGLNERIALVTSTPIGAKVYFKGTYIGVTPTTAAITWDDMGKDLRFEKDGYAPFVYQVVPFGTRLPREVRVSLKTQAEMDSDFNAALESKVPDVRRQAISDLRNKLIKGEDISAYVPHLIKAIGVEDLNVRSEAAFALGEIGEPATPALIDCLKNGKSENTRGYAALAIGFSGTKSYSAISTLIETFPVISETKPFSITEGASTCNVGEFEKTLKNGVLGREAVRTHPSVDPEMKKMKMLFGSHIETKVSGIATHHFRWCEKLVPESVPEKDPIYKIEATRRLYSVYNINAAYKIHAGAFALNKITGYDFGNERSKWLEWQMSKKSLQD